MDCSLTVAVRLRVPTPQIANRNVARPFGEAGRLNAIYQLVLRPGPVPVVFAGFSLCGNCAKNQSLRKSLLPTT